VESAGPELQAWHFLKKFDFLKFEKFQLISCSSKTHVPKFDRNWLKQYHIGSGRAQHTTPKNIKNVICNSWVNGISFWLQKSKILSAWRRSFQFL